MARIDRSRAHVWAAGGIFVTGMALGGLYLTSRKGLPIVANAATASHVEAATEEVPAVGTLQLTQESMELAEVAIAAAKTASVAEKLPVTGGVEPVADRLALVTARVPGKIVALLAGVGDRVRAGQALARVASTELAAAQAAFQQAVARVDMARSILQRQRELAALGEFGRPKLEAARAQLVGMQGSLNEAENEWIAAQNEVWQAESERMTADHEASEAESALVEARSEVTVARARLAQARSAVGVAESRFRRLDALYREGLTSRQDWEEAQAEGEKARADVDAAEAGVTQAEAKTRAAETHIASARAAERQAAAKIATAQARERQVAAKRETARQQLAIARRTLAREQKVYAGHYLTSKEIVEAEAALRQAILERDAAAQSVRLLSGEKPLRSGDGGAGGALLITSPIAGRVQDRRVTLGQTVNTEQALFTVANLDQIWVQLSVPPRDVRRVRPGQRVELTADGAPGQTFRGIVSYVGTVADETTRAVRVRCSLANASGILRPGTFMRGALITDERQDRTVVPNTALEEHSGKPTLYVERGGKAGSFEVRHVKLGVRGPGWREVTEGLEAGEKIAVGGTFFLKSEAMKSSLSDACCSAE